ncbi:MAG: trypsin-like peptidase domain-containing protein [Planctomycetaceae bacterium]
MWKSVGTICCVFAACFVASAAERHDAIEQVQPRVVKLFGAGGFKNLADYGSGFLVSSDGYIVTVWSHLLDNDVVSVVLSDGRRFFGRMVAADSSKDVAVLKIDAEDLPYFNLDEAAVAGPGSRIMAFSNVFKVAAGDEPVTVMHGVIAARTTLSARRGRFNSAYQGPVYIVDAVTNNPGAAGGVLTNRQGRLLAMLGRELKSNESNTWLNYAVPVSEFRNTVNDIIAGTFTREAPGAGDRPKYDTAPNDFGLMLVPDVVFRTPAYIDQIAPESQAATQGLQSDDLIVFANGELVSSIRVFREILGRLPPGDNLTLIVRREERLVTVQLEVPREK